MHIEDADDETRRLYWELGSNQSFQDWYDEAFAPEVFESLQAVGDDTADLDDLDRDEAWDGLSVDPWELEEERADEMAEDLEDDSELSGWGDGCSFGPHHWGDAPCHACGFGEDAELLPADFDREDVLDHLEEDFAAGDGGFEVADRVMLAAWMDDGNRSAWLEATGGDGDFLEWFEDHDDSTGGVAMDSAWDASKWLFDGASGELHHGWDDSGFEREDMLSDVLVWSEWADSGTSDDLWAEMEFDGDAYRDGTGEGPPWEV